MSVTFPEKLVLYGSRLRIEWLGRISPQIGFPLRRQYARNAGRAAATRVSFTNHRATYRFIQPESKNLVSAELAASMSTVASDTSVPQTLWLV